MSVEKQEDKEQILLDISGDKQKLSHTDEKTANSLLGRARDRITTNINPKNWGVEDYSSEKDFNSAYNKARKLVEKEFIWNNKRYSTDIRGGKINKLVANNIYPYGDWSHGESNYKYDYNELMKLRYYDNGTYNPNKKIDIHDRLKIAKNKDGETLYDKYTAKGRSAPPPDPEDLDASYDALFIQQGLPQKYNSFVISKYTPTNKKSSNTTYYALNDRYKKQMEDDLLLYDNRDFLNSKEIFKQVKGSVIAGASLKNFQYSKGKDARSEYISYYDINDYEGILDHMPNAKSFEIYDRIYFKDYGDGIKKRMYYSDKELKSLDINSKNFDTLALQRELSNRGYKLPKSIKQDGNFDGMLGEETQEALLDRQKKQETL